MDSYTILLPARDLASEVTVGTKSTETHRPATPQAPTSNHYLDYNLIIMLYMEFYPSSIFDIEQSNVTKLTSGLNISSIFGEVFL